MSSYVATEKDFQLCLGTELIQVACEREGERPAGRELERQADRELERQAERELERQGWKGLEVAVWL